MRFIVVGAGAIGGVVGGRLHQAGEEVVLVARGAHLAAIQADGLRLVDQRTSEVLRIPAVGTPAEVDWRDGDVVLLAVKGQQTAGALQDLALAAPNETPIACLQNGVVNEGEILRRFPNVYGVHVQCPTGHLEPGEVLAYSHPVTGMFDLGRYPDGVDRTAEELAAAFRGATFLSDPLPDIMRWKRRKLILNLANAAEALCGPSARFGELGKRAREEGERVMEAAGLDVATREEDAERRADILQIGPVAGGQAWAGGSSWQSLARGTGDIEVDQLNGEIVLLARLVGVEAPVNALLQLEARKASAAKEPPGQHDEEDLLARLPA